MKAKKTQLIFSCCVSLHLCRHVFSASVSILSVRILCNAHLQAGGPICVHAKSILPKQRRSRSWLLVLFPDHVSPDGNLVYTRSSLITVPELSLSVVITWIRSSTLSNKLFFMWVPLWFTVLINLVKIILFSDTKKKHVHTYSVPSLPSYSLQQEIHDFPAKWVQ